MIRFLKCYIQCPQCCVCVTHRFNAITSECVVSRAQTSQWIYSLGLFSALQSEHCSKVAVIFTSKIYFVLHAELKQSTFSTASVQTVTKCESRHQSREEDEGRSERKLLLNSCQQLSTGKRIYVNAGAAVSLSKVLLFESIFLQIIYLVYLVLLFLDNIFARHVFSTQQQRLVNAQVRKLYFRNFYLGLLPVTIGRLRCESSWQCQSSKIF